MGVVAAKERAVDGSASFLFLQSRGCMCSGLRAPSLPNDTPKGVPVSSPSIVLGPAACACALRRRQLFWPLCIIDLQATWHNVTAAHSRETRLPGLGKGGATASSGYMYTQQPATGPGRRGGLLCFWRCVPWLFLV
ncbi:hypothetical protein IG631_11059 [Alternaria alternata]|nr:hypothetical protein IG631_11059 [Alternaria alternata]